MSNAVAAVRRSHGGALRRLRRKALGDAGSAATIAAKGGQRHSPRLAAPSLAGGDLIVHVLASHVPIEHYRLLVDHYPPGATVLQISVSGRSAATGAVAAVGRIEADAWAAGAAADDAEPEVSALGILAGCPAASRQYRQIVDGDRVHPIAQHHRLLLQASSTVSVPAE